MSARVFGKSFPNTFMERSRVKVRMHIEVLCSRSNLEVAAVGRQIGLGLIGPERVETFTRSIVADYTPVPGRRIRIGCVYIRSLTVVRKPILRRAVPMVQEPPILLEDIVESRVWPEARPCADHRLNIHAVELAIHHCRIGPLFFDEVHLTHFGVIEPVQHQNVDRPMALEAAMCHRKHLILCCVPLRALEQAISPLGQHRCIARQEPISRVDLVGRGAGNNKESDTLPDLRNPLGLFVESGKYGCL